MATWVSLSKVEKFPRVLGVYAKTSQFRDAVAAEVRGSASWARKPPSSSGVSPKAGDVQVDVTSIPGVPALRKSGRKA